MAEFTPRPPEIKVYLKDGEGKIDTKDRERQFGLWLGESLTKNGNQHLGGKHKDQGLVAFVSDGWNLVKVDEEDKTEEADW
jgi:hypothetical protein